MFANVFCLGSRGARSKIATIYTVLIGFNAVAWGWALAAFRDRPVLLGTALLAYTFGLRHAVDADHIAAIDNVTRKLMQEGKRPIAVGFYFSLGHSTVVFLLCIAIAMATLRMELNSLKEIGGVIGTCVSALFLFAIAIANILVLISVYRTFVAVKRGRRFAEEDLDVLLANRGFLARWAKPLFSLITQSWQMYPLGFLFGLGFDTATEIGLLGISAAQISEGLSVWSTLVFPALFTAAMALVDTTDAILMLAAYGWAFIKPIRKLYYNMTITFISVIVALVIGVVEVLGLLEDKLALNGPFWDNIGKLNNNFGTIGIFIIGLFVFSWAVATLIYMIKGFDKIEVH